MVMFLSLSLITLLVGKPLPNSVAHMCYCVFSLLLLQVSWGQTIQAGLSGAMRFQGAGSSGLDSLMQVRCRSAPQRSILGPRRRGCHGNDKRQVQVHGNMLCPLLHYVC